MALTFEWDREKARSNFQKHRIPFDEALTVFSDPVARLIVDDKHSRSELRLILLGKSAAGKYLAVMFTNRGPDHIRLISARTASRRERRQYEETRR